MTTISDLPKDLESEILSRVPAKSIWELRTTCKRWYALFRDRELAEKNKKRLGQSVRESMLLSDLEVYAIAGGDILLQKNNVGSIELTGKLTSVKDSKDLSISEIFQCEGLMLCSMTSELVVWNRCTGQTRSVKPTTCYGYDEAYALGYTTCRSYKILRRFYRQRDKKVLGGEMYDSSSDSWRVLDDSFALGLGYSVNRNGVSLKGDAYFVAPRDKGNDSFFLDHKVRFHYRDARASPSSYCNRSNMYFESFLFDEENKVAVLSCAVDLLGRRKFATRIYIADESMDKQVYEAKTSTFDWPRIISYAPSLVHIPKSTPKKKRQKKQRLD